LMPDTFLGEIEKSIEYNNKDLLYTLPLMERKNRQGVVNPARIAAQKQTVTCCIPMAASSP